MTNSRKTTPQDDTAGSAGNSRGLGLAFKALADPTRREILRLLRAGDLTAGEIAAHFPISKPSISHHLAALRQAGLVEDERRGQNIVYSLNTTVFEEVLAWALTIVEGR